MSLDGSSNVARFLALRANEQPDRCALMLPLGGAGREAVGFRTLSFGELCERTAQLAHRLEASGLKRGERVLLMVRPGLELILCCFALFRMGAIPVVIDPGMGLASFLKCVRHTQPKALIAIRAGVFLSQVFRRTFRSVKSRVCVGSTFEQRLERVPDRTYHDFEADADALAAILFTSGSTGPPKGVCYAHGQFDAQVNLVRSTFGIEPGEVDFPMLPVFALFNPALGMTTVVPQINPSKPASFDPGRTLRVMQAAGVTTSFGAPVLWDKLVRYAGPKGIKLLGLKRILTAGAALPPELVSRMNEVFPSARVWSPYGATECLPVTAVEGTHLVEQAAEKTSVGAGICVGRPVTGVDVRIIKIEDRVIESFSSARRLSVGEIGEIVATGPSVTRSYDGLPEATAKAKMVDEEGRIWHRMGDAGYLDETGDLWFCGRLAERVETAEGTRFTECCEGIFHGFQGVKRVALIGLGRGPIQEPALVLEVLKGQRFDSEKVLKRAKEVPMTAGIKRVFRSKRFPVDVRHNAKINRLELARQFGGR